MSKFLEDVLALLRSGKDPRAILDELEAMCEAARSEPKAEPK